MISKTHARPTTAKAVAGLTLARGGCKEYLRVFHQEKELTTDRLPIVAVPTTARYGRHKSDPIGRGVAITLDG